MVRCFLSYSESYRPIMETVRRLLEILEFQVEVFDGPDIDRPPIGVAQQRIAAADCMVLLLGPRKNEPGQQDIEPAHWPAEEGVYAVAKDKPVALILHPGTRVPESIRNLQTPARFDFYDASDLLKHVHHVVKHLMDLKRRFDLPPGDQPFLYTKAIRRSKIQRGNTLTVDVYHEVVARQESPRFHHALDTGMDQRASAFVKLVSNDAYDIEASLNPGRHKVAIEFEKITDREMPYFVNVDPPLTPGERLGYRREFTINNYFPLTRDELSKIAGEDGFPALYKLDGRVYYGDVWDVLYDMESVLLAIHFPKKVVLSSKRAFAFSMGSKTVNALETERSNSAECLSLNEAPDSGERILSLTVRRPILNHQYVLLYEPGA